MTDFDIGDAPKGIARTEKNGYAAFPVKIYLDTDELYCLKQVTEMLEDYFNAESFCPDTEPDADLLSHIHDRLKGILHKADEIFKGNAASELDETGEPFNHFYSGDY